MGRLLVALSLTFGAGFVSPALAAPPAVTMYGASWCGPCRSVRGFFGSNRVPYTYVDIDEPAGREAYNRARAGGRGIPLVTVGRQRVVGANLEAIATLLVNAKVVEGRAPKWTKGEYGGYSATWWQQQFKGLRSQLARLDQAIGSLQAVAADHVEKERLKGLKEDRALVKASIDLLENDASRASLPRKFRR